MFFKLFFNHFSSVASYCKNKQQKKWLKKKFEKHIPKQIKHEIALQNIETEKGGKKNAVSH